MSQQDVASGLTPIRLKGVSHAYVQKRGERTTAITDVSLDVAPGSIVSIVGPSGCGKSTLVSIIAGLVTPTAGTVERGQQRVGFVPQRPGLLGWRTLRENIRLPLELDPKASTDDPIPGLLALTGLTAMADRYPHELSGGMQSRAAIARSLANQPNLLLLDEPFGALDELTGQELIVSLSGVLARSRPTVVMITHSLSHAAFLSDQVVVLAASPGRVIDVVPVAAPHPRGREFFSSTVYVNALGKIRERLWGAA